MKRTGEAPMSLGVAKVLGLAIVGLGMVGVQPGTAQDRDWCDVRDRNSDRERACEVREFSFDSDGDLNVDGGINGGVKVTGWNENHVLVQARVMTYARSEDRAEEMLAEIDIRADDRSVEADGPNTRRRENWGVSYRIWVPHQTDLDVETHNGGLSLNEIDGRVRFEALNGGVELVEMAGDIEGHTTNGGIEVVLSGTSWDGHGMDVRTTNGGVEMHVPEDYSAELQTGTVNGSVSVDFPIQVQGRIGRRLNATLGSGGATIRVTTTNGGVRLYRR